MLLSNDFVVWNNSIRLDDKETVGSEVASLGELSHNAVPILHRLVITPFAFNLFLEENNLKIQIKHLLGSLNHDRHDSVLQIARHIRSLVTHSEISPDIYKPLFSSMAKFESKTIVLYAHYFKDRKMVGSAKWGGLTGESVIAEHIRIAYSHLFSSEYIGKHTIHHENHHNFNVCLFIEPEIDFELTGHVSTQGKTKGEYEIEAHNAVAYSYNKHLEKFLSGKAITPEGKEILQVSDLKKLLSYAKAADRAFYLSQVLFWGKLRGEFLVTKVLPVSDIETYHDTYHSLIQNVSIHPGITIGRLKVIDEKSNSAVVMNDEIVMLRRLDRKMLEYVKKAKGLILDEDPHPEIVQMLKSAGIPTVVRKNDRFLYSTGDVVSLNATTGEIKRGSMLVS